MRAPDTRGAACSSREGGVERVTQCVQEKMWHFPSFSSSLIHPLSLICLPPLHQAHQPPPLLVRPCQGLKMHAAGWLALCRHGVEARLLAPQPPSFTVVLAGTQLGVFTPRRFRLCRPSFVTLGLFSSQKGLSFSGLDPSLCSL